MNQKKLIILVVMFILLLSSFILLYLSQNKSSKVDDEAKKWERELKTASAADFYYQLKKENQGKSSEEQHHIFHMFGQFLYQKMGLEAIAICDSAYAFGCFHGVFSEAVKDKGLNVISQLDKICEEKYGASKVGCHHGIGHGILQQLGQEKLNEALNLCAELKTPKAFLECDTGIFMEYNFPQNSSHHNSHRTIRELTDDVYSPCDTVEDSHKNACNYILVQWWDKLFQSDYQKLGSLCNSIQNQNQRESCFLGVGDLLADVNDFSPSEVIKDCNYMPEEYNKALCLAGAKGIFYAVLNYRHLSSELCEGLKEDLKEVCNSKSNFFLLQ